MFNSLWYLYKQYIKIRFTKVPFETIYQNTNEEVIVVFNVLNGEIPKLKKKLQRDKEG